MFIRIEKIHDNIHQIEEKRLLYQWERPQIIRPVFEFLNE